MPPRLPVKQGLYDPRFEHDACGVAFVVDVHGRASSDIVAKGLTALRNLDHRGASGSDPRVGDGAGMLVQVPDAFLREVVAFPKLGGGADPLTGAPAALPAEIMAELGLTVTPRKPGA